MPSLQSIQDAYERQGLRGEELRAALASDAAYQHLLRERRAQLTKQFAITEEEAERYVLSKDEDWEILGRIKELESRPLAPEDARILRCFRAQLELDWRTPLLAELRHMMEKYGGVRSEI